jgi:hypothetical protein
MFGQNPNEKPMDPFLLVLLIGLLATGGVVLLADKVVFIHGPRHFTDMVLSIPTLVAYKITQERVMANVGAFLTWALFMGAAIVAIYNLTMKHLIPRTMMKEMVARELEEEELKNRYKREARQRK